MRGSRDIATVVTDSQLDRYLMVQFRRSSAAWLAIGTIGLPIFGITLWNVATDRSRLLIWLALMVLSQIIIVTVTAIVQPRVSLLRVGLPAATCGALWGMLPFLAMPTTQVGQGHLAMSFGFILPCCVMAMSHIRIPALLFVGCFGILWLTGWIINAPSVWNPITPAMIAMLGVSLISIEMLWRTHRRSAINAITARLDSETDPLTGLLNRRAFIEKTNSRLQETTHAFFMLVDLDAFKLVTDLFGHDVGDQLLVASAGRIRNSAPGGSLVGRVGGDEIAVFVPDSNPDDIHVLCAAIVHAFDAVFKLDAETVSVDVNIGAVHAGPGQVVTDLLRNADQALLEAKSHGERAMVYSPALSDELTSAVQLRARLTRAIESGDFVAYLQPVIDVTDSRVAGFEALARWKTNEGVIPATDFISVAAAADLLPQITRLVATDVAQFISELDDSTSTSLRFAINVDLADLGPMLDWLDSSAADPNRLIVEVTEQDDTDDILTPELLASKLDSGIQVVLDDFGVAFSSFGRVLELPVAGLKIDASFVKEMLTSPASLAVIHAIASVGQEMDLWVIAEGVETAEQSAALAEMGIHLQQGYLHGHPLPLDDALILLNERGSAS